MSKKDDKEKVPKEEQEEVYGEVEQTDPTVLNDEHKFGGGGDDNGEDESD